MSGTSFGSWLVLACVAMVYWNVFLEGNCRLFEMKEFMYCFRRNGDTRKDDLDDKDGNENRKRGTLTAMGFQL